MKGINVVTGMTAVVQRVLASLFVVLAIVNVLIAIAVVRHADGGFEYLVFGLGGLLWIAAGIAYVVAASGVMQLDGKWRVVALVAASLSAFLSAFVMPTLLAHMLLDGAVIAGVLRWSLRRPALARAQ
jgi:hypothetical protein